MNITNSTGSVLLNTTIASELPGNEEFDPVKAEAGAIAGAIFGVLVCIVVVGGAGIVYLKRKREQDKEYQRNLQVLHQSSQSAGVYMDTTTTVPVHGLIKHNRGQEYKSVNKDPNMYESDSEDEL
ncbi:hypothetical protein ACF0H5_010362 [Mactra antiquata]